MVLSTMVNKSSSKDDTTQESTPKLTSKENSPKTSGGISRRLLTPCRQVGLSRNRKSTQIGLTPPFSTPKTTKICEKEIDNDINVTPKPKKTRISKCNVKSQLDIVEETENIENVPKIDLEAELLKDSSFAIQSDGDEQNSTPVKSKQEFNDENKIQNQKQNKETGDINKGRAMNTCTSNKTSTERTNGKDFSEEDNVLKLIKDTEINNDKITESPIRQCKVIINKLKSKQRISETSKHLMQCIDDRNLLEFENEDLVPLKRFKSQSNPLKRSPIKKKPKLKEKIEDDNDINEDIPVKNNEKTHTSKEFSLSKSCMKVIESKILNQSELPSRICDSADDDFDLTKENIRKEEISLKNFETKSDKGKKNNKKVLIKFENDSLKLREQTKKSPIERPLKRTLSAFKSSQNSTSSCTEDDDDDFKLSTKKTILIRKTYDKNKPRLVRAKTTGSITEKDIEDIKRRIERKKKKILDAEKVEEKTLIELKSAIDKWRVGCQQALNELLDIMKKSVPNKETMDIEELLHMLNIPIGLVKYNTEQFCFE